MSNNIGFFGELLDGKFRVFAVATGQQVLGVGMPNLSPFNQFLGSNKF